MGGTLKNPQEIHTDENPAMPPCHPHSTCSTAKQRLSSYSEYYTTDFIHLQLSLYFGQVHCRYTWNIRHKVGIHPGGDITGQLPYWHVRMSAVYSERKIRGEYEKFFLGRNWSSVFPDQELCEINALCTQDF